MRGRVNVIAFVRIMVLLKKDSVTLKDIVEDTGLTRRTVADYISHLHKHRVIRIERWGKARSNKVAYYELNIDNEHDAKAPIPMTSAERNRKYRDKMKALSLTNILSKYKEVQSESQRDGESSSHCST